MLICIITVTTVTTVTTVSAVTCVGRQVDRFQVGLSNYLVILRSLFHKGIQHVAVIKGMWRLYWYMAVCRTNRYTTRLIELLCEAKKTLLQELESGCNVP